MLGQPSPSTWRRIAGRATVMALALACGYASWAAQPEDASAAAVPSGRIAVKSALRIDGNAPQTFTHVVAPGAQLVMSQSLNGHEWTVDAVVTRNESSHGMLLFAATIRRDGEMIGAPKIAMRSGKSGTIRLGEENSLSTLKGIELVVTLTDGDADEPASVDIIDSPLPLAPPAFPAEALAKKLDGKVVLLVDFDATGAVSDVQVERSEPAGVFDAAAVETAWKWRFLPAQPGEATKRRVRVPVTFESGKGSGSASPKA